MAVEKEFSMTPSYSIKKKKSVPRLSGMRAGQVEHHTTSSSLFSCSRLNNMARMHGRQHPPCVTGKTCPLSQKICQRALGLSEWKLTLRNWVRKWYLLNAKKKKKDISVFIKMKGKLRRGVHNCKSTVSVRAENTGWLMKWLFYSDSGSTVVVYISDICHALQLLSCQCTQHIINKWASGKQLEI